MRLLHHLMKIGIGLMGLAPVSDTALVSPAAAQATGPLPAVFCAEAESVAFHNYYAITDYADFIRAGTCATHFAMEQGWLLKQFGSELQYNGVPVSEVLTDLAARVQVPLGVEVAYVRAHMGRDAMVGYPVPRLCIMFAREGSLIVVENFNVDATDATPQGVPVVRTRRPRPEEAVAINGMLAVGIFDRCH